jgi:hypothetical protein
VSARVTTFTLLLPELSRVEKTPQLAQWLARGDRLPDAKPGREVLLRESFEFIGTSLPVAALTRSLDASDAPTAMWLRADPAYAMADAVTGRLMACGDIGLSAVESIELARALRPLFGDAGFPLEATKPSRWYLRCPTGARLPQFAAPTRVLGDDLMRHLPTGDNERQWRHLFNEAQVILHNHPVNALRMQRGAVPANTVWFWGAGKLPEWVRAPYTCVVSDDDAMIALAKLAKIPVQGRKTALAELAPGESVLIDVKGVADLGPTKFKAIDLRFASGERFRYKPWHRIRFWRRARA